MRRMFKFNGELCFFSGSGSTFTRTDLIYQPLATPTVHLGVGKSQISLPSHTATRYGFEAKKGAREELRWLVPSGSTYVQ